MAFIQECFVRNPENKFHLIAELTLLGYQAMYMCWRNNIGGANLVGEGQTWHCTDSDNKPWCIDCGTNEEMFLSLAALRDDTDKNQWFVDDIAGVWERSESELTSKYMQLNGHKATAEEIVEHFKDTQS